MEKGSVLPSPIKNLDEKVRGIPLPSELPKGIDFSDIPISALKSSTLESLLTQNEDLMARLTVALRKIHELEESASAFEQDKKSLHTRFQTLKEQFQILHEKDRSSNERNIQQYKENITLKKQGEKIEKVYADLYRQAQALQKRLIRLERYKARVQRATPPIQKKAKLVNLLEKEIAEYKMRLGVQAASFRAETEELTAANEERITHLQNTLTMEHMNSINGYEAKLSQAQNLIQNLKPKADERDRMYQDLLKLENQRIFDGRQFEQTRLESEQLVQRLQKETSSLRQELKDLIVDREAKIQEISSITTEIPHLKERNQNLMEQVESLQSLWTRKQRDVEQAEEKNKSLQKLNQSLSVTLNQQRKEIQQLRADMDAERFTLEEKNKNLVTEIQLMRDGAAND